jgi:hypothetical protein
MARERNRWLVDFAERYAESGVTAGEMQHARSFGYSIGLLCLIGEDAASATSIPEWVDEPPDPVVLTLLRDVFANPFRSATVDPAWLAWNDGTPGRLAEAAYAERELPSGHLSPARLALVADALEDAGCDDAELLGHLRSAGPHVRGCWAVDRLTGRR